jgi:hypothetical protein
MMRFKLEAETEIVASPSPRNRLEFRERHAIYANPATDFRILGIQVFAKRVGAKYHKHL